MTTDQKDDFETANPQKECGHPLSLTYLASDGEWRCSVCDEVVV